MIASSTAFRNPTARLFGAVAAVITVFAGPALAQQPPPAKAPPKTLPSVVPPAAAQPAAPPGPVGVWVDHTGRGAIEIQPCGTGICGRIVWMKEPLDKKGQPLRDTLNENTRLRGRAICGLQIIGDVKPMRDGSWDGGWIYDPEQGERFDVEIRLTSNPNVLQVKGYKGVKFLSETFQWRRADAPLQPACPSTPGPA